MYVFDVCVLCVLCPWILPYMQHICVLRMNVVQVCVGRKSQQHTEVSCCVCHGVVAPRGGPDGPDSLALQYSKAIGRWTTLSVMVCVSLSARVQMSRTHTFLCLRALATRALCGAAGHFSVADMVKDCATVVNALCCACKLPTGSNFSYTERMAMPSMLTAALTTAAIAVGQVLFNSLLLQPLLKRLVPKQGEGPSRQALTSGCYRVLMVAESEAGPGEQPSVVKAEVKGVGDPGYWVRGTQPLGCCVFPLSFSLLGHRVLLCVG